MNKKGYVLRRIGHSIVTLGLILTLNFFLFRMLPGDPLRLLFTDPRVPLETLGSLCACCALRTCTRVTLEALGSL